MNWILFLICFNDCNNTYLKPAHIRCRIPQSKVRFGGAAQTIIYLHSSSRSYLSISDVQTNETLFTLNPGEIKSVVNQEINVNCSGADCYTTIWNTIAVYPNQYFVADAVGSVFKASNVLLPEPYVCFFDFGKNSRIQITSLEFSRVGTVIDLVYYDNSTKTLLSHPYTVKDLLDQSVTSPVYFIVSESKHSNISFRVVAGSAVRLTAEYKGGMRKGKIPFYNYQGTIDNENDELLQSIPLVSEINYIWTVLEYLIFSLSLILFIGTISIFIYICYKTVKTKEEKLKLESDNVDAIIV